MTAYSQNGYVANDPGLLETITAPGTKTRLRLRRGDVAYVLGWLAGQFDDRVEDIDTARSAAEDVWPNLAGGEPSKVLDDWSYAERPVRGSTTTLSNHASGTAIDLNATQHPRGVKGTFTARQVVEVRRILLQLVDDVSGRCVVRWGEDYRTAPTDGMHFEIDAAPAAVARVAARLREEEELMAAIDKIEALLEKVPARVADAVWDSDRIPVVDPVTGKADPTNPTWQPDSVLRELLALAQRQESAIRALRADVAGLKAAGSGQ